MIAFQPSFNNKCKRDNSFNNKCKMDDCVTVQFQQLMNEMWLCFNSVSTINE